MKTSQSQLKRKINGDTYYCELISHWDKEIDTKIKAIKILGRKYRSYKKANGDTHIFVN